MRFPDAFVVEAPPKDRKSEDRLVVEPTPLKNMISSVGMMTFPTEWKVINFHGSKPPTRRVSSILGLDKQSSASF
jgi:hypothetical protein